MNTYIYTYIHTYIHEYIHVTKVKLKHGERKGEKEQEMDFSYINGNWMCCLRYRELVVVDFNCEALIS